MNTGNLHPPRWRGGPHVCIKTNLPAFETKADLLRFMATSAPACPILKIWDCVDCEGWHARTTSRDPSGGSSGTGRHSK